MYLGFTVSLLLHAAVLGWALVSFQATPELPAPETPLIEAQLVTLAELTRLKQGDPDAKVLEAKQQDKPNPDKAEKEAPKPKKVAALPPPPAAEPTPPEPPKPPEPVKPEPPKADPIADKLKEPPPPAPTPEPTPGPTPDEQKKLEEKLEQDRVAAEQRKKEAEEARKAEEKRKAEQKKAEELKKKKEQEKKLAEARKKAEEAKKKQFDANKLSALLNKIPDAPGAPPAASAPPTQPTQHTGPSAGERQGTDTVLTANEIAMIGSLIKQHIKSNDCWHFQAGAVGAQDLKVKLELNFLPDGRLAAEPRIANSSPNPQFGFAAESAIRAVKACEPFNMLPADKYATIWKRMYFTFDPSTLF